MATIVETAGWDGEWFRRAYDYFGKPVGSRENAGGPDLHRAAGHVHRRRHRPGRRYGPARRSTRSEERLATPHGIVVNKPAFTYYHLELGEISTYPPGYKENAGIFCHTNPWLMIAEAMTDNGDGALDYYMRINPSAREEISEIHRCEPYVYAQMIAGKDAPTHGEAKNSWLSGTAAWNFVAISQWILGIRAEYDGLRIDPVLPADWESFTATRKFRGATYNIKVNKVKGQTGRVARLTIDGRKVEGNLIPLPAGPGGSFDVEAFLQ